MVVSNDYLWLWRHRCVLGVLVGRGRLARNGALALSRPTRAGGLALQGAARRRSWRGCSDVGGLGQGGVRVAMQVGRTGGSRRPLHLITVGVKSTRVLAWRQGGVWGASPMGRGVPRLVVGTNVRYRWLCGIVWAWVRVSWRHCCRRAQRRVHPRMW